MKAPFDLERFEEARSVLRDIDSLFSPKNICCLWVVKNNEGITLKELQEEVEKIEGIKKTQYRIFSRLTLKLVEAGILETSERVKGKPMKLYTSKRTFKGKHINSSLLLVSANLGYKEYIGEVQKVLDKIFN